MGALWQAAVPTLQKQYLIVLFSGDVVASTCEMPRLQKGELSAAAILPHGDLSSFVDHWKDGLGNVCRIMPSPSRRGAKFQGWEINHHNGVQSEAEFADVELEGDGGLRSGISGGHRFGIIHFLMHQNLTMPYAGSVATESIRVARL